MCLFCQNDIKKLGFFIKRNDFAYSGMQELRFEFKIQIFEIQVITQVIELFMTSRYKNFDALVGDCKCQVRASMLIDIIQDKKIDKVQLSKIKEDIEKIEEKFLSLINETEIHNMIGIKKIIKNIQGLYAYDFFEKYNLNYNIPHDLFLIVLLYLTYLKSDNFINSYSKFLSSSKALRLLKIFKKELSLISIEYEQNLAKKYGTIEIQKILNFITINGICSMTAFYPSFIPVWQKIKDKKQLVLKKNIYFCKCGGVKDIGSELFRTHDKNQFEKIENLGLKEAAFVIEGYSFDGALAELKNLVGASIEHAEIKEEFLKICTCSKSFQIPVIENLDEAILANFAQHKQFTNDAEIPWVELGLENSDLKKEYDRLRTLSGYGIHDMSKFCITHIYASTVGQELEDQRQLLLKLGKK